LGIGTGDVATLNHRLHALMPSASWSRRLRWGVASTESRAGPSSPFHLNPMHRSQLHSRRTLCAGVEFDGEIRKLVSEGGAKGFCERQGAGHRADDDEAGAPIEITNETIDGRRSAILHGEMLHSIVISDDVRLGIMRIPPARMPLNLQWRLGLLRIALLDSICRQGAAMQSRAEALEKEVGFH
jgi:hypothetical protein